jgi:hypothetical protein
MSDPHLAAPFFAPRAARRRSLTPYMQVTIIRRDSAMPVTLLGASPFPGPLRARFIQPSTRLTGFAGNSRSYK